MCPNKINLVTIPRTVKNPKNDLKDVTSRTDKTTIVLNSNTQ